ncbi:hypothetical protein DUT90_05730 [Polaribacter sp. WD7]|uniref:hypothetical protein n=1 Tax=Polaribacter sp. WD7 TaxID=2269061 RepID=UPI000DF1DDC0|nr:hypothetical protein [Polaribacter sp. WD7]RCS27611.1 hypothetical protein DUT90_05730 [Polaribacter sp. WD7]
MNSISKNIRFLWVIALAFSFTFSSCQSESEVVDEIEDIIAEDSNNGDSEGDSGDESEQEKLDEDTSEITECTTEGTNSNRETDIVGAVNVGKIDDRSCYANYKESFYAGKTWGVYNITDGSNHQDKANTLQPRIERSLSRSQTTGVGSFARFTGTVRILEAADTPRESDSGTYIMQAKGKHTGGGGSADPAICLYIARPVFGTDENGNRVQVSFDIYREQINFRGGSGANGRQFVYLTNIKKNEPTSIVLEVGFREDPNDASKKIHYADAVIGGETFRFNIPEPEKGTQSGIRYGAYRVKGGRAQIRWADTTYRKVEVE